MKYQDVETAPRSGRRGQQGATLPRVRAVSRAIAILRSFTPKNATMALNEIARSTGLDAGTARRILVTLRDEGMIHQDAVSGLYSLSTGCLELSRAVPRTLTLASLVEQRLVQLARDTQTTVYLSVVRGDQAICAARHNGGSAIEVRWWMEGESRAFNLGTGPRVLLAHLDDAARERILSGPLKLGRDEEKALREEIAAIRKSGFIVKHDEIAVGISAMAVPLLDDQGRLVAAVSTGGLTTRYVGADQAVMLDMMQSAAEDMRKTVRGYAGQNFNW